MFLKAVGNRLPDKPIRQNNPEYFNMNPHHRGSLTYMDSYGSWQGPGDGCGLDGMNLVFYKRRGIF
jgi:hypothetical protein